MGLSDFLGSSKTPPKEKEVQDAEDMEELDEENGSILMSLIGQLRIGMDLSRVTLPTFVLEPRSMLERITDFMSHPDLIFGAGKIEDPAERFVAVMRYYLAGWHIKPKGVKKPYNPVLGEFFECSYTYGDGSHGYYIAEQVSHHPPISAYFYCSPDHNVLIYGELRPKSRFLGNSAATLMGGESRVVLLDRPDDGEYVIGMPNMYARGILFGKMILELGDASLIECKATKMSCTVEFKTKGYFTGTYNAIEGRVAKNGKTVGEVTGKWSDTMDYKKSGGKPSLLFTAKGAAIAPKSVRPESEQAPNESRRLWAEVTKAIQNKDMNAATEHKTAIEDAQRRATREREENNLDFVPRFFAYDETVGRYVPRIKALPASFQAPAVMAYFAKHHP